MRWFSFRIAYFQGKDALEKKRYAEAEGLLERALRIFPDHPDAVLLLAQAQWHLGKKEEARKRVDALSEKELTRSAAAFLAGIFFKEEGKPEEAREAFRRAVASDPKNPEVWYERGKVCASLADPAEALHAFRAAVESDPFLAPYRFSILKNSLRNQKEKRSPERTV